MTAQIIIVISVILVIAALLIKPIRKAIGLLMIILGAVACFSVIGLIIGIPLIFVGSIILFI